MRMQDKDSSSGSIASFGNPDDMKVKRTNPAKKQLKK